MDVYYRPCINPTCHHHLLYDGQYDGVFNKSNKHLFTYESMFDYWDGMTTTKLSFTAHHAKLTLNHNRSGTAALMPSCQTVRLALQGFLALLDIQYNEHFGCPCCSKLPDEKKCLIGDGTTLGFRKDLAYTAVPMAADQSEPRPDL